MRKIRGFPFPAALLFSTASTCMALLGGDGLPGAPAPQRAPLFRTNVEMVVVRAAVTDPLNRYVVGLEKEHFRIFDNKIEQSITHFASDDSPLSVGIVFDVSGSMSDNLGSAKSSVVRFLQQGTPQDEYFLVTFNERTALVQDFTGQSEDVRNRMSFVRAKGRTALYDAIYAGLQKLSEAHNDKKALIVITDGEDNSSRYTFSDVKEFAKESDAQIYAIGEKGNQGYGRALINELVSLTGGRAFFPNSLKSLDYYCDLIHTELRNQYVLGYIPSNASHDGKWRKLKVQLQPPDGLPRLNVRTREGYFASKR
ncbi:MAG: VWA domain-containing protein [Acidobacteria bacterium]|nr:VWA domain-containing protein [Acidobacteriota bacterium]